MTSFSTKTNFISPIFTILFLVLVNNVSGQTFQKTYGSISEDIGNKIILTPDDNYIISGMYGATGGAYLLKIDSIGNSVWQKTFDPPNMLYFHYDYSLMQTPDSGFILAGSIYLTNGNPAHLCLIKTNSTGDTIWTKIFAGPNTGNQEAIAHDVIISSDGGYVVVGNTRVNPGQNIFLIKTDSSGNLQWSKNYGGTNNEEGYSIQQTPDSGFVIAGYTNSFGQGGWDGYLLKVSSDGNLQWTKTYGGNRSELVNDIEITSEGDFILTGYTSGFGTGAIYDDDLFLIKTDSNGNIIWSYTYGADGYERGYAVKETSDGGYIATGYTTSSGAGQQDVYLLRTDSSGNILWSTNYGGSTGETGIDVLQHGTNFIVVGVTKSFSKGMNDVYLIKTDSLGIDSCRQGTAITFKTILPWSPGSGGTEDSGYNIKSDVIILGTPDTSSFNVCICIPPVASFYSSFIEDCGSFNSTSTWADSWYWDLGGLDTSTADAANQCFGTGTYLVCLTVNNACGTDSYCDTVYTFSGIDDLLNNKANLHSVPNPFENFTTIKFDNSKNEKLFLEIVNPMGQIERQIDNIASGEIQIERNNLKSGVYFILLKNNFQIIGRNKLVVR